MPDLDVDGYFAEQIDHHYNELVFEECPVCKEEECEHEYDEKKEFVEEEDRMEHAENYFEAISDD